MEAFPISWVIRKVRIYSTNRAEAQKRGKMLLTNQYANTFTAENGAVQTQIPQIKFTDDEIDTLIAMFGTPASYNSKGCLKKLNELSLPNFSSGTSSSVLKVARSNSIGTNTRQGSGLDDSFFISIYKHEELNKQEKR